MAARITVEQVPVTLLRFQFDHLGYTRCGDHVSESRGGVIRERQAADVLREADAAGSTDAYVAEVTALTWTCDTCGRYVTDWPTMTRIVDCVVEHTSCRIF